jgi:uncharacterized glyoxalase superfamily protein PhnB
MSQNNNEATVWPCIRYADPFAAIEFLQKAFGFRETIVVPTEDGKDIVHAELRWPLGGGIMLGSVSSSEGLDIDLQPGSGFVYVVTDEPDELFVRATAQGATEVVGLRDEDYGSRGFTVRDPEGNTWSFGTYRGEA